MSDQISQVLRPQVEGAENGERTDVPDRQADAPSTAPSTAPVAATAITTALPASTTTTTRLDLDLSFWRVIFDGAVNVRMFPSLDAPAVRVHWKCALLHGRQVGDWLEVYNGTEGVVGYSRVVFDGSSLLEEDPLARSVSETVSVAVRRAQGRLLQDADDYCTPCAEDAPCKSTQWQIKHPGHVMVYPEPDNRTTPLGMAWNCDLRSGYPVLSGHHQQWLKLTDEKGGKPGYIQIMQSHSGGDPQPVAAEVTASFEEELDCDACVEGGENSCLSSQCCKNPGHKCYQSSEYWATCQYACTPSNEDQCLQLGTRSWAPELPGFPTLYCWQLMRPDGYEPDLVRAQVAKGAGIFGCDGFDVYSIEGKTPLGKTPKGQKVQTVSSEPHDVGRSKDGFAANVEIFLNAWNAVEGRDQWRQHAWTIKMDPDAVMVPDRVRVHIMSKWIDGTERSAFFRTCNRFPSSSDYPMMYGAMEVISREALRTFFKHGEQCRGWFPVAAYGEDLYLTKCLQGMNADILDDFVLVGDDRCKGGACWDHAFAAFHEHKDIDGWMQCWSDTGNGSI